MNFFITWVPWGGLVKKRWHLKSPEPSEHPDPGPWNASWNITFVFHSLKSGGSFPELWRHVWKVIKLCVKTPQSGHTRGKSVTLIEDPSGGEGWTLAKAWSWTHVFIRCVGHFAIYDRVLLRSVSVKSAGLYKYVNVMDSCLMDPFGSAKLIIIYQFCVQWLVSARQIRKTKRFALLTPHHDASGDATMTHQEFLTETVTTAKEIGASHARIY